MKLTVSFLIKMYIISCIIGLISVYFSYHTLISSSVAWIKWGNDQAWVGDSVRIITLCFFALLLTCISYRPQRDELFSGYFIANRKSNWFISIVFLLAITCLNFIYYPPYFEKALLDSKFLTVAEKIEVESNYFSEVYKPYFTYFFYPLSLWMGIILPTFLIFVNGFFSDYSLTKKTVNELIEYDEIVRFSKLHRENKEISSLKEVLSELDGYVDSIQFQLSDLAQRYFPTIMVVWIGFGVFNILLSSRGIGENIELISSQTNEARSSFGWIIIIFFIICIVFIASFAGIMQRYRKKLLEKLWRISDYLESEKFDYQFKDLARERRRSIPVINGDILVFSSQILLKSGSFHIPLLAALTSFIFYMALGNNFEDLLPIEINNLIQKYFTRESD